MMHLAIISHFHVRSYCSGLALKSRGNVVREGLARFCLNFHGCGIRFDSDRISFAENKKLTGFHRAKAKDESLGHSVSSW
jgi:hypothetical protein